MNIIRDNAAGSVNIGFVGEYIQRAGSEKLQSKRQIVRFLFGLFQQFFTQGTKGRHFAGLRLLLVNGVGAAVDNRLVVSA